MKQSKTSPDSSKPTKHSLRDEDVVTKRADASGVLSVRTDIRAGTRNFHGSDFNH